MGVAADRHSLGVRPPARKVRLLPAVQSRQAALGYTPSASACHRPRLACRSTCPMTSRRTRTKVLTASSPNGPKRTCSIVTRRRLLAKLRDCSREWPLSVWRCRLFGHARRGDCRDTGTRGKSALFCAPRVLLCGAQRPPLRCLCSPSRATGGAVPLPFSGLGSRTSVTQNAHTRPRSTSSQSGVPT